MTSFLSIQCERRALTKNGYFSNFRILCWSQQTPWAVSSAVEHLSYTQGVAGSNPVPPTRYSSLFAGKLNPHMNFPSRFVDIFGQNMGFFVGAKSTSWLIKPEGPFSPFQFMLLTAIILIICILLTLIIHKREVKRIQDKADNHKEESRPPESVGEKTLKKGGGFRIIFKSKYLIMVAFVILTLNYVNTTGEYIRSNVWKRTATEARETGRIANTDEARLQYYTKIESDFTATVNLLAWLIQLFLVARIFKWVGVRRAMLFLPFISLGGYFLIGLGASYAMVKWTKTLENSTDYSLMNTVKQALFLITNREAKYKAKAAIDTFFVRAGDVLVSLTVFVGTTFFALNIEQFARLNVAVIVIWIILCFFTLREHKRISP
jgi:AAA family ATP:ADP antiporter